MLAVVKLVKRRLYQCRDGIYGGCSIAPETCKRFKKELLKLHLLEKYSRYLDDDD
jgi:hypothetical protein